MESKARLRSPHEHELQVCRMGGWEDGVGWCRMAMLGMVNMESAGAGQQQQEHKDGADIRGGWIWIPWLQGFTTPGDSYNSFMYSVSV